MAKSKGNETRLYKVTQRSADGKGPSTIRIVEAATPAAAVHHVVKSTTEVEVLDPKDALVFGARGILPEVAESPTKTAAQQAAATPSAAAPQSSEPVVAQQSPPEPQANPA